MSIFFKPKGFPWLILAMGFWLGGLTHASSQTLDITQEMVSTPKRVWIQDGLSYYRNYDQKHSFEEIRLAQSRGEFQSVEGYAISTKLMIGKSIWLYFTLDHFPDNTSSWWLLLTPEHLQKITLYAEQSDGTYVVHHGGTDVPFVQREMPGIAHGFELGLNPKEKRHYFIHASGSLVARIELSLWQEKALINYLGQFRGTLYLYVGMMSVLTIMVFLRTLQYRKPLDIAYLIYLLGFEMFNLGHNGFMQASGLVDSPSIRSVLVNTGLFLTGVSFFIVTQLLIAWPRNISVWLNRVLGVGLVMTLTALGLAALLSPGIFMEVSFNQAVIWVVLSGLIGLWATWRNYPNARFYTACFLPFVVWSAAMSVIRWLETPLPNMFMRYWILMITSFIHLFALWYLILSNEARLALAKHQLEAKVTALQDEMSHIKLFVAMLGHELNRPLTALARLIGPKPTSSRTEADTDKPLQTELSAIHMEFSGILETCMDRMRYAAATQLDPQPVNLGGLIQGITEHFQLQTTDHVIGSDVGTLPSEFICDPKLISILLINLIDNALRHSPPGGAIWTSGCCPSCDTVILSVSDEGLGIPDWAQERIFERYFRLDQTSNQNAGMGLGLFIVRRIAELHGGGVACESEPGAGATFRVKLRAPICG